MKLVAKRFNMGAAGFLANLLREARSKRKYAIMRDPFRPVYEN
jgi:hypothetical protein